MRERRRKAMWFRLGATLWLELRYALYLLSILPRPVNFLVAFFPAALFLVSLLRESYPGKRKPGPVTIFWRNGLVDELFQSLLELSVLRDVVGAFLAGHVLRHIPSLLALVAVSAFLLWGVYRWGDRQASPKDELKSLAKGKAPSLGKALVVVYNETDHYISSFAPLEDRPLRGKLFTVDWARDVLPCRDLTPEGERLFREKASLALYILPAADRAAAQCSLDALWQRLWEEASLGPCTMLAVVFVMPEPFGADQAPVPACPYPGQCSVQAVSSLEELSIAPLIASRYQDIGNTLRAQRQYWAQIKDLALGDQLLRQKAEEPLTQEERGQLQRGWRLIYLEGAQLCRENYAPVDDDRWHGDGPIPGADPQQWDPLLREFFRFGMVNSPSTTSMMSLMDFMDMVLRLVLYTVLTQRGETEPNQGTVPSTFRAMGELLTERVKPGDLIYETVRERAIPVYGVGESAVLAASRMLHCKLSGSGFSLLGLCGFLSYFRNKTRGHGSIRAEDGGIYWGFAVTAAQLLGQMLRLDAFRVCREGNQVLAGWNGDLVALGKLALANHYPPVLAFTCLRGHKRVRYIDYFNGSFLTPSLIQGDNAANASGLHESQACSKA